MIALPATPSFFDYNPATGRAVIVMPGPDYASVAVLDPAGVEEIVTIPLQRVGSLAVPEPNPVMDFARFGFTLTVPGDVELQLVDSSARSTATIGSGRFETGVHEVVWNATTIASGAYFAVLSVDGIKVDARKVILAGSGR